MSLTFTIPAPTLSPGVILTPNTNAHAIGSSVDVDGLLPNAPLHLGQPSVTSRPVEVWREDGLVHVRLPTNGACADTSRLGIEVLAAAMRASGAAITDEEGETYTEIDAFLERYDATWCEGHARFGLSTLADALQRYQGRCARMPTFFGDLTVRQQRALGSGNPIALTQSLRRRAWIHLEAPEAPMGTARLGDHVGRGHDAAVYEVVLGQKVWLGNHAAWVQVDGVPGLLPIAEFVLAYGDHAESIDDGCVLLQEVTGSALTEIRTSVAASVVKDIGYLKKVPRIGPRDRSLLLTDMELVDATTSLVHPDHILELLAAHNKDVQRVADLSDVSILPQPVRELLAAAPVRAALLVAVADGTVDVREKIAIVKSAGDQPDGPMKDLWLAAFGQREDWAERVLSDQPAPHLALAAALAEKHLEPAARAIWCHGVMARANATANASGGFLGFIGNRVGPEERQVLDDLKTLMDQTLRMP